MFIIYQALTIIFYPIFTLIIYIRKFIGKEDTIRFKEKIFLPPSSEYFKDKKIIWFHGASIGEIQSVIPIINYFLDKKELKILITSSTLSSGKMIENEFSKNENIFHYYFPFDANFLINGFLNNFKPNAVVFIDSEIWPNFMREIKKREIPLILINGRITKKTFKRWSFVKSFSNNIFSLFDLVLASSKESFKHLLELNCKNIKFFGNLKFITKEKTKNLDKTLRNFFDNRKVWCAASTHRGEEVICLKAHREIKNIYPELVTIIIPRHISRIKEIFSECKKMNLQAQVLNNDEAINEKTEVILINSFGVLNQYYNYCKSVFIGKSLCKKLIAVGGQNPLEASRSGCKIYVGPYVYNFNEIYIYLESIGIVERINNEFELSSKIINDLKSPKTINSDNLNKIKILGNEIFDKSIKELLKFI
ncbi:MAG: 3-deoxy-D-manno-octulosonic acid transferase [Pelagibacteraceae bacterium]